MNEPDGASRSRAKAQSLLFSNGALTPRDRELPAEVPVALSFNGTTEAVMMATPGALEDFGIGFALSEGIVTKLSDISDLSVVEIENGFDVQMSLAESRRERLAARRRKAMGPVGCGLCGIESIDSAMRTLPKLDGGPFLLAPSDIGEALSSLNKSQELRQRVGAVHAAAFWQPGQGLIAAREDVGRHNALDKLIGAVARAHVAMGEGAIVITSRVSVDLIQKTVMAGVPVLIAVSTPTGLAVDLAQASGLTLIALARDRGFEIFSHPERLGADDTCMPNGGNKADVA